MGNKSSKPAPASSKTAPNTAEDTSNDEDEEETAPKRIEEAEPFIDLLIFQELPHGSTLDHMKITVNPMRKVIEIKRDLSRIVNIPCEHIQIYRHQRPQTEMPNECTLHELLVPNDKQLRVRDSRITYSNPITVQ